MQKHLGSDSVTSLIALGCSRRRHPPYHLSIHQLTALFLYTPPVLSTVQSAGNEEVPQAMLAPVSQSEAVREELSEQELQSCV